MPKDKTDYYSPKNTRKNKKKKNKKKLKHGNKDDDDDIDDVASNIDFQKLLYTMFPSKHQQEKVQKMEAMDKLKDNVKENKKNKKRNKKKRTKNKAKNIKSQKPLNMEVIANIMNECDVDIDDAIDLLNKYDNNDKLVLKYHTKPVEEETYDSEDDVEEEEDSQDSDDDINEVNEEDDEEEDDEEYMEDSEQQFNIKFVVNEKDGAEETEEEEEDDDEEDENNDEGENKEEASENPGSAVMSIDFGSILNGQFNKMYNYDYGIEDDANFDEEGDDDYVCNSDDEKWINAVDNVEKMLKKKRDVPLYQRDDEITVKLPSWSNEYEGKITNIYKLSPKNKKKRKKKKHIKFCYKIELINIDETPDEVLEDDLKNVDEQYISKKGEEEDIEKESDNEIKLTELKTKLNGIVYLLEDIAKKAKLKKSDKIVKQTLIKDKKKIERKIQSLNKKVELEGKAKRFVSFRNLLKEQSNLNHLKYFRNMKIDEQDKIVKTLKKVNDYGKIEKPYIISVLNNEMPIKYKSIAVKKINSMNYMDPSTGEYYKMKHWVDNFMRIPFSVNCQLPITIEDGIDKVNDFMDNAKGVLDGVVYGLEDAKMQIMQMIGQWITNPTSVGTAIAIKGPMGTGKTTLVKEGISKIMNRPFTFIALGGATDSSFLEGHSYTYEGSIWGKIVDVLIHSKCMNPVFYFDELDKVSNTPKGEEIIGILTHLTDTTQNTQFHDKYFSNIDFNLSRAMFIFSYNDETKINTILKDRMYHIETKGYELKDKYVIAEKFLIPSIEKNVKFNPGEIIIPEETISYICNTYTQKEKGVRNLKRAIEIIFRKLNLFRLMKKDSPIFENEKAIKVEFPFTVTPEVAKLLIKHKKETTIPFGMYL